MTVEPDTTSSAEEAAGEEIEEFKCYIGRVPTKFTEEIVKRILIEKLEGDTTAAETNTKRLIIEKVELIYPHDDDDDINNNNGDGYSNRDNHNKERTKNDLEQEHRGFGFVLFATAKLRDAALKLGTIKGGRKKTAKKLHTMYLRPYVAKTYDDDDGGDDGEGQQQQQQASEPRSDSARDVCYLWNLKRCPYGDDCKFRHVGDGGCIQQLKDKSPEEQKRLKRKRMGKCFVYKKKGECPKGEECPFSHDFEPDTTKRRNSDKASSTTKDNAKGQDNDVCVIAKTLPNSVKDCINWKTKGKCRKGDKCVYKHDLELQKKALEKIAKRKKRSREVGDNNDDDTDKKRRKEKQPISIRVFGMNYDTTEADIKEFIESTSGHPVMSIVFPIFEDSRRSKGYCGVYFGSPKAAKAAVENCDNAELHGRWLRVQTGKSMTIEEWEGLHHKK